ncbi:MAG TPA: SAVED domain-containing protein [Brevundimonas sp.]|uniref:Hachiman antiphage defense system protein HamA n=1 Tax=Brevundimonas sp. TaxID=1871086 RepID=UPI00262F6EA6|nr:Hachiman antiphage defense system protein HamA [Brevundimonas sp.]HRO33045.1 SAVED domain-containing protein [Brevundimonas sp.]
MANIKTWCDVATSAVGAHALHQITVKPGQVDNGVDLVAEALPEHYVAAHHLARVLRRQGKPQAAALVEERLPTTKQIRSGDLGEILGVAYVNELTDYEIGVFRLQWKDHRNMAMRGDDLIGIAEGDDGRAYFLKGEAKSAANIAAATITAARAALAGAEERPTPHALLFLSEKYLSAGREEICDLIDEATLDRTIDLDQVEHLIFTFTGNAAGGLLTTDLQNYAGTVSQIAVNFHVPTHQNFIQNVFDTVIANARQS